MVLPQRVYGQYVADLAGTGVNHDDVGGFCRARLLVWTTELADPCDFPKCGKLECVIYVSGEVHVVFFGAT